MLRLTDRCKLSGWPGHELERPCEFRVRAGGLSPQGTDVLRTETIGTFLVGPDAELVARGTNGSLVRAMAVVHKGTSYPLRAVVPRYRTRGRLHHVELEVLLVGAG